MRTSETAIVPAVGALRGGPPAVARGLGWIAIYVLVTVTPLVVALAADRPAGRDFWLEFSVALGFVGLAILGLQFAVVSRFSTVNTPFGLDVVLRYHRDVSFVALAFVVAHPLILVLREQGSIGLFDPTGAGWTLRAGQLSLAMLAVLIATSVWRLQLRIRYEVWRVAHGFLAVVVVASALVHIERVGYYVSGVWNRGLWILYSAVFVGLLVNVRIVKPLRLLRRPWVVESVRAERGDAWSIVLQPVGHPGIRFAPGQFAWLRVERSPFTPREHPFSFSSSADHSEVRFTVKAAGDFTSTVGSIPPGSRAYLDGPYGVFTYERNEGPRFVFVAGGIGIAPVMSMLRTLADRNDRRPCLLVYGNRTLEEAVFTEELDAMRSTLALEIVHVLETSPASWHGERGRVTSEVLDRHLPPPPGLARYFLCGPAAMMADVHRLLRSRGVPPEFIEFERFDLV